MYPSWLPKMIALSFPEDKNVPLLRELHIVDFSPFANSYELSSFGFPVSLPRYFETALSPLPKGKPSVIDAFVLGEASSYVLVAA